MGGTTACEPMDLLAGLGAAPGSSPSASLHQPSTFDRRSFLGKKSADLAEHVSKFVLQDVARQDVTTWEPATFTASEA